MPSRGVSVLVVDDDERVLRLLQRILELEGYRVFTAGSGEAALNMFEQLNPDLVLLDIMMPGMDGLTVCQRIREFSDRPIIMVTAKGNDEEKVRGLDAGADDYVTKPFSAAVLVARIKAVLRRANLLVERPERVFRCGDLVIDPARRLVTVGGVEVRLTATEYALLSYLALNAGRLLTPDQILEKVWGDDYLGETHLLQVNIARLRRKLGDNARNAKYIVTRPGIGYMMLSETQAVLPLGSK